MGLCLREGSEGSGPVSCGVLVTVVVIEDTVFAFGDLIAFLEAGAPDGLAVLAHNGGRGEADEYQGGDSDDDKVFEAANDGMKSLRRSKGRARYPRDMGMASFSIKGTRWSQKRRQTSLKFLTISRILRIGSKVNYCTGRLIRQGKPRPTTA